MNNYFYKYPRFDYNPKSNRLKLTEKFIFQTSIKNFRVNHFVNGGQLILNKNGEVIVCAGFTWDAGTGAIDTLSMIPASLLHDALCDLINANQLPWMCRKLADKEFKSQLKFYGYSNAFERQWRYIRYYAVRFYAKFIKRKPG